MNEINEWQQSTDKKLTHLEKDVSEVKAMMNQLLEMQTKLLHLFDDVLPNEDKTDLQLLKSSKESHNVSGLNISLVESLAHFEAKLFHKMTDVYFKEEKLTKQLGNQKQSSRRVSVELNKMLEAFLQKHVPVPGIRFKHQTEGVVVAYLNQEAVAAIKLFPDLGFVRGDGLIDKINEIIGRCSSYNIPRENFYFIVGTLHNSVEKKYVSNLLNKKISFFKDFFNNKEYVEMFITKYKNELGKAVPNPDVQILFLTTTLHPNELGKDLYKGTLTEQKYIELLTEANWHDRIMPWIGEIVSRFDVQL